MGTHPIFESDFDCLTDRPDLLARMSEKKAVIKNADMSEDMQSDVVECATQALEKYNIEKDIAAYIKKEFDKKYRYRNFRQKKISKKNFKKISKKNFKKI